MNKIVEELRKTGVFYVATLDEDNQPRVRPFSSLTEINGSLYLCTNNTKDVYKQIQKNSKIEICGMGKDGTWIRIAVIEYLVAFSTSILRTSKIPSPSV